MPKRKGVGAPEVTPGFGHDEAARLLAVTRVPMALLRGGIVVAANDSYRQLAGGQSAARAATRGWQAEPSAAADLGGATLTELILALDRGRTGKRLRVVRVQRRGARYQLALERVSLGGRSRTLLARLLPTGRPSERERELDLAEAQLRKRAHLASLGQLALGVAHDVSNVFGAVMLRMQVLADDPACRHAQEANLAALTRILRDGSLLVGRLQSFTRPSSPEPRELDLLPVVRAAIEVAASGLALRGRGGEGRVRIDLRLPRDLPRVRGLAAELQFVFLNLLINAREAMRDGGRIIIDGEARPDEVIVRFDDEGHGIAAGDLPRVFDVSFSTKGQQGSGLGLAMAKAVMESIGGRITASNRPDGGARFELAFARRASARRSAIGARTGRTSGRSSSRSSSRAWPSLQT